MDAIRSSARENIDACKADFENPMEFLDNLTWIYDDLVVVEDQFQDRFPPDWKVRRHPLNKSFEGLTLPLTPTDLHCLH